MGGRLPAQSGPRAEGAYLGGRVDKEPCKEDVPDSRDVRLRPIRGARGLLVGAADLETSELVYFQREV